MRKGFDPGFATGLRSKVYGGSVPKEPSSLGTLHTELEQLIDFQRRNPSAPELKSSGSGNPLLDADDMAILNFLNPATGAGPSMIQPYTNYHDSKADDFVEGIKSLLDNGETAILDLSNANPEVVKFFSLEQSSMHRFANSLSTISVNTMFNSSSRRLMPYSRAGTKTLKRYIRGWRKRARNTISVWYIRPNHLPRSAVTCWPRRRISSLSTFLQRMMSTLWPGSTWRTRGSVTT